MPATAFGLGTWQVLRWQRKLEMIDEAQRRIEGPGLDWHALTDRIRAGDSASSTVDGEPCVLRGVYRHDREMLVGPRQHDGATGYHVVTPLVASSTDTGGAGEAVLVNRGWIDKRIANQKDRPRGVNPSPTTVRGLLRTTGNHNMFTPDNDPVKGQYYWVDVQGMSKAHDTLPVVLEETIEPGLGTEKIEKLGIPVPREHGVTLVNNHVQYIVTWYALAIATAAMSVRLFRKSPPNTLDRRVRR